MWLLYMIYEWTICRTRASGVIKIESEQNNKIGVLICFVGWIWWDRKIQYHWNNEFFFLLLLLFSGRSVLKKPLKSEHENQLCKNPYLFFFFFTFIIFFFQGKKKFSQNKTKQKGGFGSFFESRFFSSLSLVILN